MGVFLDRWRAGTVVAAARAWAFAHAYTGVRVELSWVPPRPWPWSPGRVEVAMGHEKFGRVGTAIMTTPAGLEDAKRYVSVRMERLLGDLIVRDTYGREECVGHKDLEFN